MKTLRQFLEATESDLKSMGANPSQIEALKKRQAKRGYGFQSNDERNTSAPEKSQSAITAPKTTSGPSREATGRSKGGALVKQPTTAVPQNKIVKSSGGALAKKTVKVPQPDEKQAGTQPGTSRPKTYSNLADEQRKRVNDNKLSRKEKRGLDKMGKKALKVGKAALTDKDNDRTKVAGPSGDVSGGSTYQSRTQRN